MKKNMEQRIDEIGTKVATLLERSNNNSGWMKGVASDIRRVKDHLSIINGRIVKNEKDVLLLQQAAKLKGEYRNRLERINNDKGGR